MPAYYAQTVVNFLSESTDSIELKLTRAYESDRYKELMTAQITAWRGEIEVLKDTLEALQASGMSIAGWGIALEFVIPRRMGRVEVVLLVNDAIVGLEFKTKAADSSAAEQVEDYCLD